jgi:drug/metabolite transporter (DMT)-like permease
MRRLAAWQADLLLLAVAFVWGTTFVLVKNALGEISPFAFLAIRFLLAFIFLSLLYRPGRKLFSKATLIPGLTIGIFLFGGYAFQTVGLKYTTAANAGFITGLSVILVPFFSMALTRQIPNSYVLGGALLASAGLALLTLGSSLALQKGDLLVFFCACSFALHIICVGRYAKSLEPAHLAMIQILAVGTLSAFIVAVSPEESLPAALTAQLYFALVLTAILATSLAILVQNSVQRFTTPARTAVIFATEPVFAALTAYTYGGEELTGQALLGAVLVFAGILLAELKGGK